MALKNIVRNTVIGATLLVAGGLAGGRADGGVVSISNTSSVSNIGKSTFYAQNISAASEGYDIYDSSPPDSPYPNALKIYSSSSGSYLGTDSHPINTTGWDILLGVKGSFTNTNNYLRYAVTDTTDLVGKTLVLSDTGGLFTAITLNMDGGYHNISLPNLTHGVGTYDTLRLDVINPNFGNATADKSNSQSTFGSLSTVSVPANGSYSGLESKVTSTSGSGAGAAMVGSTATMLAGTNNSGSTETVGMQWRTQTLAERNSPELVSDIVRLSGMDSSGASPFVLEMNYNPALLPTGVNEGTWASEQQIYLADLKNGKWDNAALDNTNNTNHHFYLSAYPTGDLTLGDWGVDTVNHEAWAVVNYNADFAVVPEPTTISLLAMAGLGVAGIGYLSRLSRKRSGITSDYLDELYRKK